MPEPKEHMAKRGAIEEFIRKIPGFKGYLEKEYRRESDSLQRQWMADELRRGKRGLDDGARELADAGDLSALPKFDRSRAQIDKLLARIQGAMRGYSGLFDAVKIDEAVLDKVYEHDLAMMSRVESLVAALKKLGEAPQEHETRLPEITKLLGELAQDWDGREDILKGVD